MFVYLNSPYDYNIVNLIISVKGNSSRFYDFFNNFDYAYKKLKFIR
jgi:hypothetical protein